VSALVAKIQQRLVAKSFHVLKLVNENDYRN
jgi:hypothetical protein